MPRDISNESEELKGWLKPVTAFAENRGDHLPAHVDPVLDTLVKARDLIADPKDWYCAADCVATNAANARNGACIHLAIMRTGSARADADEAMFDIMGILGLPRSVNSTFGIWKFNDTSEHADVLALFDRAIASRKVAAEGLPAREAGRTPLSIS